MKNNVKKLGVVGVDSGTLVISDPAYIESRWKHGTKYGDRKSHPHTEFSLASCFNALHSTTKNQLSFPKWKVKGKTIPGMAVAFSSGFGDGLYPVYANVEKGRIQAITIKFFEEGAMERLEKRLRLATVRAASTRRQASRELRAASKLVVHRVG